MKKNILFILVVLLAFSAAFAACSCSSPNNTVTNTDVVSEATATSNTDTAISTTDGTNANAAADPIIGKWVAYQFCIPDEGDLRENGELTIYKFEDNDKVPEFIFREDGWVSFLNHAGNMLEGSYHKTVYEDVADGFSSDWFDENGCPIDDFPYSHTLEFDQRGCKDWIDKFNVNGQEFQFFDLTDGSEIILYFKRV